MKLRKSCFGMDYEMETLIQAFRIQINMVWNQFHGIIHELIGYALALALCIMHYAFYTMHVLHIYFKSHVQVI